MKTTPRSTRSGPPRAVPVTAVLEEENTAPAPRSSQTFPPPGEFRHSRDRENPAPSERPSRSLHRHPAIAPEAAKPSSAPPQRPKARPAASRGSQIPNGRPGFACVRESHSRTLPARLLDHARTLLASTRALLARAVTALSASFTRLRAALTSPPTLRITLIALALFLAALVTIRLAHSEIDLDRLLPTAAATNARPLVVVQDGRLVNAGDAPARNLEVTKPRYRLVGTLGAGQSIAIPGENFTVQYEWNEGDQQRRATRSFTVGGERASGNERVAGTLPGVTTVAQSGVPTAEPAPSGIAATYDPATHLLTVAARTPVEVRVDGFLLRPVSVTDRDGAQYRYVQSEILVLGQNLKQGETTTFEVVFTKPQDFYSIPIYVREPGKQPVYFTVNVATKAHAE